MLFLALGARNGNKKMFDNVGMYFSNNPFFWHFIPPLKSRLIIALSGFKGHMLSGRIGVCGFLDSFGLQSDPLVNWNQPLVGGIFPILPFISYWVGEGVI